MKWWIGCISCIVLFGVISTFAYMKMIFLVTGVSLHAAIERSSDSGVAKIKGMAAGATYVTLNGREIFIDKDGSFTESLVLLPGLSVVKLDTEDKFGHVSEKKFEVVYTEPGESMAINNSQLSNIESN
jgi:hypothetical protein